MKRKATDTLTGGTKDVNPQFLNFEVTTSAANTFTEVTLGTPIVRVGTGPANSRSVIMEILKVFVEFPELDLDAAAATNRVEILTIATTTQGTTQFRLGNPRCLVRAVHSVRNAFTAAGTGMLDVQNDPVVIDLTDGDGHGVLVATDNIFIGFNTAGFTAVALTSGKILYRFKEVELVEYIGIVQSQQ